MQAFRYRFAQLLSWRESQLEMEKAALGLLCREQAHIEQSLALLKASGERAYQEMFEKNSITGAELAYLANYRDYVVYESAAITKRLDDCRRRLEAQRERVVKAERECKLLDRLKQREYQKWSYEVNREMENTVSDLFLGGLNRERSICQE